MISYVCRYKTEQSLKSHIDKIHAKKNAKNICKFCGKGFSNSSILIDHIVTVHQSNEQTDSLVIGSIEY